MLTILICKRMPISCLSYIYKLYISYYHRGQVYFIQGQFDLAMKEYAKSSKLDDTFIFSQIQYAVSKYKKGEQTGAITEFKKLLHKFGKTRSEVHKYVFMIGLKFNELILST